MIRIGFAVSLCLALTSAYAQKVPDGSIPIWGRARDTCGTYVLALQKHQPMAIMDWQGENYGTPSYVYSQWIAGYVSAQAMNGRPITYLGDINGMAMWIKNYCEKNPTETVFGAAVNFVEAHRVK